MHLFKSFVLLTAAATSATAIPVTDNASRDLLDGIYLTDDLVLFDAPAFPNPSKPGDVLAEFQTFVFTRLVNLGDLIIPSEVKAVISLLSSLGIDAAKSVQTIQERLKLFTVIGLPGKATKIKIPGCSQTPKTGATGLLPDLGISLKTVSLGSCGTAKESVGTASLELLDSRTISNDVYFSPDSGFGVFSDIDDTVKVSHVLDKLQLAKATLIDEPQAVAGMPELYTSLSKSLSNPQFIYITGSPFQLYPFLNKFIDTSYPSAKGPLFLQNLTIINPVEIVDFLKGGNNILEYKTSVIDRVKAMYPKKKWLAIGDSTQKDPETYAQAFRKYGDSISCIWIRRVDGANNTDVRFNAAFSGVPTNKFRIYTDSDIPNLSKINVAGGEC